MHGTAPTGHWLGFPPPQYLYAKREFKGVALNPPDFNPGSWIGAGKAIYDLDRDEYLLSARPRSAADNQRGFAAEIYRSANGITDFTRVTSLSKAELMDLSGEEIHSVEGTQILRDPLTRHWHFYVSIDVGSDFVWGGLQWETLLLTAETLEGPWESRGLVLRRGTGFDANQARDGTIDVIDGRYYCLYKGKDKDHKRRPGLATSTDGVTWEKHGQFTIAGQDELAFLSGSLFPGGAGLVFLGTEMVEQVDPKIAHVAADEHAVRHGSSLVHYCAYTVDVAAMNLDPIVRMPWEPLSPHEHPDHPLLGYSTTLYDPRHRRFLMYLEIIDGEHTGQMGLNETVERVVVYESRL